MHTATPIAIGDLPDLRRSEPLTEQIVIRVSSADRAQLEQAAAALHVPVGRLARAILRHALGTAAET